MKNKFKKIFSKSSINSVMFFITLIIGIIFLVSSFNYEAKARTYSIILGFIPFIIYTIILIIINLSKNEIVNALFISIGFALIYLLIPYYLISIGIINAESKSVPALKMIIDKLK